VRLNNFLFNCIFIALFFGILMGVPYTQAFADDTSDMQELKDYPEDIEQQSEADLEGTTPTAETEPQSAMANETQFEENSWFEDFEVHFLVSLPFTALYSYVTVMSLDSMVQGKFPPDFHQADTWIIIGVAVGSSLAVALGSVDRVPDQSSYQIGSQSELLEEPEETKIVPVTKLELVKILY
jgi:hypothetical protein